jgi:PrtD family type I secretion system ABC transporter
MAINESSGLALASLLNKERGVIASLLFECRRVFILAFVLSAVLQVISLAPIVYMMNMMDRVMTSRSVVTLISLTVILVAAYLFGNAVGWLRERLLLRLALRLDWELSPKVFDAAFRRFAGRQRVNAQVIMSDLVAVRKFFMGPAFLMVINAPYALMFVGVCMLVHPWLAIFAMVNTVLMAVLAVLKARAITPLIKEAGTAAAETSRSVAEVLRHSETAMALGMQSTIRKKWFARHQSDLVLEANGAEAAGLLGTFSALISQAMPRLTMGLMVYLAISGEVSAGMTIGAMFLVQNTIGPMQALVNQWPQVVRIRTSMERLESLIGDDKAWKDRMPLPAPKGQLTAERLTAMAPRGKKAILSDINFSLQPGQVLAVVGPSAAGKSTLARHLVGILQATEGTVRLDGADLYDWMRSDDVPNLGYVPQDIMVLEGTVAENISRLQDVDPAAVVRAAELIDLHKTILGFPDGYNTMLGDGSFMLTGGQKQRLIIARALYGDPKLVVMDEPSSSLDADSEAALLRLLRILRNNNITVVVTTHRPNLVAASDMVLVLDKGTQVQFGATKDIGKAVMKSMTSGTDAQLPTSQKLAVRP